MKLFWTCLTLSVLLPIYLASTRESFFKCLDYLGCGCSTPVEHVPRNQEVVGLNTFSFYLLRKGANLVEILKKTRSNH